MLNVNNLHAHAEDINIIKGLDLSVVPGEIHAIMGPNGSGKSTLANIIAGHPDYTVSTGEIRFDNGKRELDLTDLDPYERAGEGIFVGFQYPVEVPGVSNRIFLRESYNAIAKYNNRETLDPFDFEEYLEDNLATLNMDESFLDRPLNEGFSGGEKKKNEILQMSVLDPRLIILDETDSGLDIDALRIVADGINAVFSENKSRKSVILITHYQRLLDYVKPDFVHILKNGRIVRSGNHELALELEEKGYEKI